MLEKKDFRDNIYSSNFLKFGQISENSDFFSRKKHDFNIFFSKKKTKTKDPMHILGLAGGTDFCPSRLVIQYEIAIGLF